jgi:hypothetical protein
VTPDNDLFQIAFCPHGNVILRFGPNCIHLTPEGFRRVAAAACRVVAHLDARDLSRAARPANRHN